MVRGILQLVAVLGLGVLLGWTLMSDAQKRWLKHQAGLEIPELPVVPVPQVMEPPSIPMTLNEEEGREQLDLQRIGELFQQHFNCVRPETGKITEQPRTQIYSWVDSEGRRHFSDQAPEKTRIEDLSQQYGGELAYFDLNISSPDGIIATGVRDRLETDVRAIYRYLTKDLGIQHMRKVALNLKIYVEPGHFEKYRNERAPGLSGAAGFYTTDGNEAVVLQRSPAHTLRVSRHEATHVIVAGLYGRTPMWFNEGLAEFFADYEAKAMSRTQEIPFWRAEHLRQMMEGDRLPDLEGFLRVTPIEWRNADPATMYSMAWSVVAFLMATEDGRDTMVKVMDHLNENPCSTVPSKTWIEDYYAGGWDKFEDGWHHWLNKRLLGLARK
ncbi:DUF1570 domain-containing protein [Hahella ganghwensis]|uniref:DUF1570 domain-containing protein n=1 Tax=Hahella ganghwensis TaxID=286420 RepID=UPI0003669445|nr:DUF1570 domain-containing protein [Hahella ganghwensis]